MPRKKPTGLLIPLDDKVIASLGKVELVRGLPIDEFLRMLVMQALPDILDPPTNRGPGRPARPAPPKLPDDIERGTTASGFAGVYQNGRYWKAFWDKGEGPLGVFETPEEAALARYWYNKGRLSVTIEALKQAGASQGELEALSKQLGADLPKTNGDDEPKKQRFHIGDLVDYDPAIGKGPIKRAVTVVAGPLVDTDGNTMWWLQGFPEAVRDEDLDFTLLAKDRV